MYTYQIKDIREKKNLQNNQKTNNHNFIYPSDHNNEDIKSKIQK